MCCTIAKAVKADLGEAGFVTNDEKSVWETWWGITWDSARGTIEIVDGGLPK